MTYLNCDNEEMSKANYRHYTNSGQDWPGWCTRRGTRFVIVVSRMRESQPLTESSAAAIGHSKQRRGWQSTVSRWIRPCDPRAPILPRGDLPATCCTARRVTALG